MATAEIVDTIPTYKVVLIGESGVGKTTLIHRHTTGEFLTTYSPTQGVNVTPLVFYTTKGKVILNVWDCAGQDKYKGLGSGYYIGAAAGMLMFDTTSKYTFERIPGWLKQWEQMQGIVKRPTVLCGNKIDCTPLDRKYAPCSDDIKSYVSTSKLEYYEISAKANTNFTLPFLYLIRNLMKDPDLTFVEGPPVTPPEVKTDLPVVELADSYDYICEDFTGGICDDLHDYIDTHGKEAGKKLMDSITEVITKAKSETSTQ